MYEAAAGSQWKRLSKLKRPWTTRQQWLPHQSALQKNAKKVPFLQFCSMVVFKQHTECNSNWETNQLQAKTEAQPQRHMYACSSPCRKKVRQRKCEVMKKVGGMIMYVLGFVRFEWTSLRHLESADLQSNFVSKGNAPQSKTCVELVLWTTLSPLCLRMVYHETSFEAQGVFPQNGNSWN